ncbi:MAG TPA: DUF4013 domain-containing protein [Bacteroidota bacterium]|nr:DUF4013 domain-containing protein [Bacteroidota bacterium]
MTVDLARSLSYMFKDSSWFFKVFLGGLFLIASLLVIGLPFIFGYEMRLIVTLAEGKNDALPEWKNMKRIFSDGVVLLFVLLIYIAAAVGIAFTIDNIHPVRLIAIFVLVLCVFWRPLLLIQFAKHRTFRSCFMIREMIFPFTHSPQAYTGAMIISSLVLLASVSLGWMSLILGWPFVVFWGILVESHVTAQFVTVA